MFAEVTDFIKYPVEYILGNCAQPALNMEEGL